MKKSLRPAAVVSSVLLGGAFVLLAGSVVLLPSTKSSRISPAELQIFRESKPPGPASAPAAPAPATAGK